MTDTTSPIANVVILGGNGAMGSLFCRQLAGIVKQVVAIDLQQGFTHDTKGIQYIQANVCNLSGPVQNALSQADLVIAALPETVTMKAWQGIVSAQKKSSLFVDTLSVKTPFINAISQSKSPDEIISINPMFAPSLGFSGQSSVVIDVRRGPIANAFIHLLESWGCRLVFMTAEEHDRHAAMLQTLTHAAVLAFGMSLQKLNYDLSAVESIMPPPHRTLLALVARILSAEPEVYWDIQASNPYAGEARDALESSIMELCQLIDEGKKEGFISALSAIEKTIGHDQVEKLNQYCARIFSSSRHPREGGDPS